MYKISLLYISLLSSIISIAQTRDVGVWTGFKISQPIDKKMEISLSEGFRLDNNISNVANVFTQLKSSYEIAKGLNLGVAYRWARKESWINDINFENRYQFDLSYNLKFNDLKIKNRVRFQSKYVNYYNSEYGFIPTNTLRNETSVSYSISKKIKPYASFEFFYPSNINESIIDKLRYQLGTDFKITKDVYADVFFIYQKQINSRNLNNDIVFGCSFSYELPKLKTKKKDNDKSSSKEDIEKEEKSDKKIKKATPKIKEKKKKKKEVIKEDDIFLPDNFDDHID